MLSAISSAHAREQFIAKESDWQIYHEGAPPESSWNQPAFDDADWTAGVGSFGYGKLNPRTKLATTASPRPVTR